MLMDQFNFSHQRVKVLRGGLPAWWVAGYPIEKSPLAVYAKGKISMVWGKIKFQ